MKCAQSSVGNFRLARVSIVLIIINDRAILVFR